MIDTDKYEGHTLKDLEVDADLPTWGVFDKDTNLVADYNPTDDVDINEANARLIADAPLLLAEVIRLRKQVSKAKEWVGSYFINMSGDFNSLEDKVVYDDFMQQMGMKKND